MAAAIGAIVVLTWIGLPVGTAQQSGPGIPDRLSDEEFWTLSDALSEPPGQFHSDNLVSNEMEFQKVLPALAEGHAPGGVYLGVGPEQNFTYIAAIKPRIAFVLDIRAENRGLHLLYKALFELARNRAEFVSLLFSRPLIRPVTQTSTAADLFAAIDPAPPTEEQLTANVRRVFDVVRERHHWSLSVRDADGLRRAYQEFARSGVAASYTSNRSMSSTAYNTYGDLMQATDATGKPASYLASEAHFQVVKDLEERNLVVPVVGDFSGPIALRAIGDWLRAHQGIVSVFYLSNVEDYLEGEGSASFCRNVATLPIDDHSEFIRSSRLGTVLHGSLRRPPMQNPITIQPHHETGLPTFKDMLPKPSPTALNFSTRTTSRGTELFIRTALIGEEITACRER